MDHSIKFHTIAKTPVSKKFHSKLSPKKDRSKEVGSIFNDECDDSNNEKSYSFTSENDSPSPLAFVTKRRVCIRKIVPLIINSSGENSFVLSNKSKNESEGCKQVDTSELQNNESLKKEVDRSEITNFIKINHESINTGESDLKINLNKTSDISNVDTYSVSDTPNNLSSNTDNVTPETAKIMNEVYGKIWQSTPDLFKKKKSKTYFNTDEETYKDLNVNSFVFPNSPKVEHNISFDKKHNRKENNNILSSENISIDKKLYCEIDIIQDKTNISKYREITETSKVNIKNEDEQIKVLNESIIEKNLEFRSFSENSSAVENVKDKVFYEESIKNINISSVKNTSIKKNLSFDKQNTHFSNSSNTEKVEYSDIPDIFNKKSEAFKPLSSLDLNSNHNVKSNLKPCKLDFSIDEISKKNPNKENINKKIVSKKEKNISNKILSSGEIKLRGFMASLSDDIPIINKHKQAVYYIENFKTKKEELAIVLFKLFNKNVFESKLPSSLRIAWSTTLLTTAGRAHNKIIRLSERKDGDDNGRSSRIELSTKVIDCPVKLRKTLAHELCHVATWLIDAQMQDGHGKCWKAWTAKVLNRYPEIGSIPINHSYDIFYKYTYICVKCGRKINRHSKSIDVTKKRCGYCYATFECVHNKKTKDGMVVNTPIRTRKEITGFALYVKENYGNVRSGFTPHKETMKLLGRQYAQMKLN